MGKQKGQQERTGTMRHCMMDIVMSIIQYLIEHDVVKSCGGWKGVDAEL